MHVGAHKTGTSLVQKYFRDKSGVTEALRIAQISRTDGDELVGWGEQLHDHPELLRSRLEAEAAKRPAVLLMSHEDTLGRPFLPGEKGMYPDARRNAEALAAICDGFDAHLAFYVRPMADFLESYYLQTVQEGAVHSFDEWYDATGGMHAWTPVVEALEDAFGAERVFVGDFTEISGGQNQFLRQFMIRTGVPQPREVNYQPIRNASISARGLEMALDVNPFLNTEEERLLVRKFLQKHFSNRREDEARARPMPEELRASIAEESAAEWESLAARAAAGLAAPPDPPKTGRTGRLVRRVLAQVRR